MRIRHSNDPVCTRCNKIMEEADSDLVYWFFIMRSEFIDLHVSCAWRGEHDQNFYFKTGKSKVQWPNSKHNVMENGSPCSKAIDVFRLKNGMAEFRFEYYKQVSDFLKSQNAPILWGGDFKKFKDGPHFELNV